MARSIGLHRGASRAGAPTGTGTPAGGRPAPIAKMVWGGTTPHNFTAAGSNGTHTLNDTADVALGSVAAKVVTTGTGAQSVIGQFGGTAVDMTGRIPCVWIKVENLAHLLTLNFWAGANGLGNAYTWSLKEDPNSHPWIAESTWVAITLPLGRATVTGTPPRSALTDFELQIYDDSAGQVTVHFGGLGFVPEPAAWPNGVVTFSFDDGLASQFSAARPRLDQYGYRGTAFMITETLADPVTFSPNYMTLQQAHKLEDMSGWDVCPHASSAANHNAGYSTLSPAAQVADMVAARSYLLGQGFRAPYQFAWPLGDWTAESRTAARSLFESARTLATVGDESLPPADASKLRVFTISNTTTLAAMTAAVDRAYASKSWINFVVHDIVTTPATSTQMSVTNFNSLVDYVATKGIPVRTVAEVMNGAT